MRQAKQEVTGVGSFERQVLFGSGSGVELQYPARLVWPSPWVGHIPFAFWLVEALRPSVVVELGVQSGNSYCAFLQGIQSLALVAQCYGIDHWRGDEHSDHYGDDVYAELCSYHDPLYGTFSTLIRATFEEALPYFADRSIDLLHIDGFHTYEAVAKDFSDWLPKLSARAVVLFHDINVREREFGVWRFWEEIAARYPTVTFVHSHGLGLAYVGSEPPPVALRALLATLDPDTISRIRSYFARLGTSLIDRFARRQAEGIAGRVRATEAELEAARVEVRRHVEAADALRIEVEKATGQVALLQEGLAAKNAEVVRQSEVAARLQQDLSASRAEREHQIEATRALERQCSEARAELARQTDAVSISQMDARKATDRITLLEEELESARAEMAAQREATDASRATADEMTERVATLETDLSRARRQMSEAIAQRERATQLLRQQITATTGLQRELAALTERLDGLTTEHVAEAKRAEELASSNREIRQELERARQELQRVHVSVANTLAQPRYVVADRCNAWLKKAGFLHVPLKRVWAAWYRGR
jgi:Methyltransferase domain